MPSPFDPWRHVDADDDLVADLLAGTVEAVVEAGGWIHPHAVLLVRDGTASVVCAEVEGGLLLHVPRSCFLPLMRVEWGRRDDALEVLSLPDDATDLQRELLILQVAFHNARGALPALVRTHPAAAPDLCADVIEAVRALRPDFRMHAASPVDLFWTARAFRVPVEAGGALEPVGVPLVDLLDHHAGGATPTLSADGFDVPVRTPIGSSCRLDYGRGRDALDLAIVYGFADISADITADISAATAHAEHAEHAAHAEHRGHAADSLALLTDLQRRAAGCTSPAAAILREAAEHQARVIQQDIPG